MPGPRVTLFTIATSPYGLKVQAYLAFKRIPHDIVYVDPLHPRRTLPLGRIVPVLRIDDESRNESQHIARWLDARFPDRALYPDSDADRARVTAIDDWLQNCFIPGMFQAVRPRLSLLGPQLVNGLRLGRIVDRTTPDGTIGWRRYLWPLALARADFIRREARRAPGTSPRDTFKQLSTKLRQELADAPFLGGAQRPTIADLSAYALVTPSYEFGLLGGGAYLRHGSIRAWASRVRLHLDPTMPLVPDGVRVNSVR